MPKIDRQVRRVQCTILIVLTALSVHGQSAPDTLNVFFVGNSYTYYNNLPELVEGLSESLNGAIIRTGSHTHPGFNLRRHLEDGHLQTMFEFTESLSPKWDRVVLQDNSWLGRAGADATTGQLSDPSIFHSSVRELKLVLDTYGALSVLYMTWAKKRFPTQTEGLRAAYDDIGSELGIVVSPVGLSWARVRSERPDLVLFNPDGSHPSVLGSYLTACVMYAQLTGTSPEGATNYIEGNMWHFDKVDDREMETVIAFLTPEEASYLQTVAWETVKSRSSTKN